MFRLENNRECFYQWDSNQRLVISDSTITEVHYCNRTDECSLITEVYVEDGVYYSNVPNVLLQTDLDINVYAFDTNYTKYSVKYKVRRRSKPADYVYTDTELVNWNDFKNEVDNEITELKALITTIPKLEIMVVDELPTADEALPYTIYLVKSVEMEDNLYTEYLYVNDKWELLGSTETSDIDLSNYVKKTDIATSTNAGLTYASNQHGIMITSSGQLRIIPASDAHINGKTIYPYYPITPKNLDYAVKAGITKNDIVLTDEEKTKAKNWLGISNHATTADYAETANTANSAVGADVASSVSSTTGKVATLPELTEDAVLAIQKDITDALVDYYTKNQTYTRAEIDAKVSAIPKFAIEVVGSLPTTNISNTTIYLLVNPKDSVNMYDEYLYVNNQWEKLGEQKVDLTGYATETYVSTNYQPKGNYALKTDIPTMRNMDFAGEALSIIQLSDGSTIPQIMIGAGNAYFATAGSVATQKGITYIFDGSKWNSIKVKMPTTETLTITGVDADGVSHSWDVWGVAK